MQRCQQQQQQQQASLAAPSHTQDVQQHSQCSNRAVKKGPCDSSSKITLVDVDLLTGEPASAHICDIQPWRVARVRSYAEPHSVNGHGEGGKRAHQSYQFYKHNGRLPTSCAAACAR